MTPGLRNKTRGRGGLTRLGAESNFPKGYRDLHHGNSSPCSLSGNSLGSKSPVARRPLLESPASEIRSLPLVATWVRLPGPPTAGPLDPARHQATVASREDRGGPSPTCWSQTLAPRCPRPAGHSLTSQPATWRGGAGTRPPPPPPRRLPEGLRAVTARTARLAATERLLHLLRRSRGRRTPRRRSKGGRREGRDWGGRAQEGEEHRKTCPVRHDVTSGWFGRGGAGRSSAPRGAVGAGLKGHGRSLSVRPAFESGSEDVQAGGAFPGPRLSRPSFRSRRKGFSKKTRTGTQMYSGDG